MYNGIHNTKKIHEFIYHLYNHFHKVYGYVSSEYICVCIYITHMYTQIY